MAPVGVNAIKIFHVRNLQIFAIKATLSVPDGPFQPSLMFVGKAKSLPLNGKPERCFQLISHFVNLFRAGLVTFAQSNICANDISAT